MQEYMIRQSAVILWLLQMRALIISGFKIVDEEHRRVLYHLSKGCRLSNTGSKSVLLYIMKVLWVDVDFGYFEDLVISHGDDKKRLSIVNEALYIINEIGHIQNQPDLRWNFHHT